MLKIVIVSNPSVLGKTKENPKTLKESKEIWLIVSFININQYGENQKFQLQSPLTSLKWDKQVAVAR